MSDMRLPVLKLLMAVWAFKCDCFGFSILILMHAAVDNLMVLKQLIKSTYSLQYIHESNVNVSKNKRIMELFLFLPLNS